MVVEKNGIESMKSKIVNRFNKNTFELVSHTSLDKSWDCIDEYIRDFMIGLNKSKDIATLFSCEGHTEGDQAYIYFNLSSNGWDIFWQKVLPEISYKFCKQIKIDGFSEDNMPYYQLTWHINITDNDHSAGISINTELNNFSHNDKKIFSWIEKKKSFWKILEESFYKHFNIN